MSKDFLKHTHDAHRCNIFFFKKGIGATVYISTIISFFPLSTILLNVERHKWNLRITIMVSLIPAIKRLNTIIRHCTINKLSKVHGITCESVLYIIHYNKARLLLAAFDLNLSNHCRLCSGV